MQFQVRLFYDGHLEEKLQCPSPNVGEALSSVRLLRDKPIGVLKPGRPSGAILSPRALICGSSIASATLLIGPPGTPALSRSAISAACGLRLVLSAIKAQSVSRFSTRAGLVAKAGLSPTL